MNIYVFNITSEFFFIVVVKLKRLVGSIFSLGKKPANEIESLSFSSNNLSEANNLFYSFLNKPIKKKRVVAIFIHAVIGAINSLSAP